MVVKGTMVILKSRVVGQIDPVNVHFCHGWWIQMVFSDLILRMRNKILVLRKIRRKRDATQITIFCIAESVDSWPIFDVGGINL